MFNFLKKEQATDINTGVTAFSSAPGSFLIDVREPGEYADGHIPGSLNLPLGNLKHITNTIPDKNAKIFLYCYSGARSAKAERLLYSLGYTQVQNIGGIANWRGALEK